MLELFALGFGLFALLLVGLAFAAVAVVVKLVFGLVLLPLKLAVGAVKLVLFALAVLLGRLLLPAAASLALFAWLLTLHPAAAGRTYAAYGGMYIAVALVWLRFVDGVALTRWDIGGATIALVGMAVIALQPQAG